jgi:hypothetical protein
MVIHHEDKNEEPVSRFWACFFALGIFALFWTQKIEKTRKWILMALLSYVVNIFGSGLMYTDEYLNSTSTINEIIFISYVIILLILLPLIIYFMFKWTTKYNLKNFGYKSKKEWKRSQEKEKSY